MEQKDNNSTMKSITHNFSLDTFQKVQKDMIATNDNSYDSYYFKWDRNLRRNTYSAEEIEQILNHGNLEAQRMLSQFYFNTNGLYKQIVSYYATLLKFSGILIPKPSYNKSLQDNAIAKRYYNAASYSDRMKLPELGTRIAYKVLIDGIYFGAIQTENKETIVLMDLPFNYCRSRFKDQFDRLILEFNVNYFNTIALESNREAALKTYPKVISNYYRKWKKGLVSDNWMFVPTDVGVAFTLMGNMSPYFLSVIPTLLQYDIALENEQKREISEIKKILVNKIPHLNDGTLLFEPPEAAEMHAGLVGMLGTKNPEVSIMTTYGDAEMFDSRSSQSLANNTLKNMLQNVYSNAGVSSELFASSGSASLKYSNNFDVSLMMSLGNRVGNFITDMINKRWANGSVSFRYMILPLSLVNEKEFIDNAFKMASSGYSFLLPAIAQGFSQTDFVSLKELENKTLKLQDVLVPLSSAFTASAKDNSNNDEGGRPESDEKSDKTIENIESKDKTGNG